MLQESNSFQLPGTTYNTQFSKEKTFNCLQSTIKRYGLDFLSLCDCKCILIQITTVIKNIRGN